MRKAQDHAEILEKNRRLRAGIYSLKDEKLRDEIQKTLESQKRLFALLRNEQERLKISLVRALLPTGSIGKKLSDKTINTPLVARLRSFFTGSEGELLLGKMELFSAKYQQSPSPQQSPLDPEEAAELQAMNYFSQPMPPLPSKEKLVAQKTDTQLRVMLLMDRLEVAQKEGQISSNLKHLVIEAVMRREARIAKRTEVIGRLQRFGRTLVKRVKTLRPKANPPALPDSYSNSCTLNMKGIDFLPDGSVFFNKDI